VPPLVSVLIPCFNAGAFIGETLESVLRQTWPSIEIVIVDDGSTDNSAEVIAEFARASVTVVTQANKGAAAARNHAFERCSGDFIQFLDADDVLSPAKLEVQLARLFDHPNAVAAAPWEPFYTTIGDGTGRVQSIDTDKSSIDWVIENWCGQFGNMLPARWLSPRAIVQKAGPWRPDLSLADDGEYFTRLALCVDSVLFADGGHCYYRNGVQGSLSDSRSPRAWASLFTVLDLCEGYIRARRDDETVRNGFAIRWQDLAYASYPYDHRLAEKALVRAGALSAARARPEGGLTFQIARRVFGWRAARMMQVASGRP
jgi:glycosyltransferase involved in cell wall biosynthesis